LSSGDAACGLRGDFLFGAEPVFEVVAVFPTAGLVELIRALADLDLSQEPWVLSVPAMGSRFWVMQLIDTWNGVPHAPGSRSVPPPTATTPVGNPVLTISAEAGLDRQAG